MYKIESEDAFVLFLNSIVGKIANKNVKQQRGFDKPYSQKMPRLLKETKEISGAAVLC